MARIPVYYMDKREPTQKERGAIGILQEIQECLNQQIYRINTGLKRIEMMKEHQRENDSFLKPMEDILHSLFEKSLMMSEKCDAFIDTIRACKGEMTGEYKNIFQESIAKLLTQEFLKRNEQELGEQLCESDEDEPEDDSNPSCDIHSLFNIKREDIYEYDFYHVRMGSCRIEKCLKKLNTLILQGKIKGE